MCADGCKVCGSESRASVWCGCNLECLVMPCTGLVRVQGLGFRVQGSGFRVQGSGFRG